MNQLERKLIDAMHRVQAKLHTDQGKRQSLHAQQTYRPKDRIDWLSSKLGVINYIPLPVVSDLAGYLTLAEEGYNAGKQLFRDQLRMKPEKRNVLPDEKLEYLATYFSEDFDPGQIEAKRAYHARRGWRMAVATGIDLAVIVGNAIANAKVPGYAESLGGWAVPTIQTYFAIDGLKNGLLGAREADEYRHLTGRLEGKKPLLKKIKRGVKWIGIKDTKDHQVRNFVYQLVRLTLNAKELAFGELSDSNKQNLRRVARRVERADYMLENPSRPTNFLRRVKLTKGIIPTGLLSKDELIAERDDARLQGYHYVDANAYDPYGPGYYAQG